MPPPPGGLPPTTPILQILEAAAWGVSLLSLGSDQPTCGAPWRGEVPLLPSAGADALAPFTGRVHFVIAQCGVTHLPWFPDFVAGHDIGSVTIFSKCGKKVDTEEMKKLSASVTEIVSPNVGRCDHAYAAFLSSLTSSAPPAGGGGVADEDVVFFVKDTYPDRATIGRLRALSEMVAMARTRGFACAQGQRGGESAWHNADRVKDFKMRKYERLRRDEGRADVFESEYKNMGEWLDTVGGSFDGPVVEVCYQGNFATTGQMIRAGGEGLWANVVASLERGDNVEEGHFAERAWAGLLGQVGGGEVGWTILALDSESTSREGASEITWVEKKGFWGKLECCGDPPNCIRDGEGGGQGVIVTCGVAVLVLGSFAYLKRRGKAHVAFVFSCFF